MYLFLALLRSALWFLIDKVALRQGMQQLRPSYARSQDVVAELQSHTQGSRIQAGSHNVCLVSNTLTITPPQQKMLGGGPVLSAAQRRTSQTASVTLPARPQTARRESRRVRCSRLLSAPGLRTSRRRHRRLALWSDPLPAAEPRPSTCGLKPSSCCSDAIYP